MASLVLLYPGKDAGSTLLESLQRWEAKLLRNTSSEVAGGVPSASAVKSTKIGTALNLETTNPKASVNNEL